MLSVISSVNCMTPPSSSSPHDSSHCEQVSMFPGQLTIETTFPLRAFMQLTRDALVFVWVFFFFSSAAKLDGGGGVFKWNFFERVKAPASQCLISVFCLRPSAFRPTALLKNHRPVLFGFSFSLSLSFPQVPASLSPTMAQLLQHVCP